MPQMGLDTLVTGRLTKVPMQDPELLYEQAKQRMSELHTIADRRRGRPSTNRPWFLASSAIARAWRRVSRHLVAQP